MQTFEIYNSDTINKTDHYNCKQGKWILMGKHKPHICSIKNQIIEQGEFKNNRKTGSWTEYHCNGIIKSKIPFVDGMPMGHCTVYYKNGKIQEEGDWKNNRYVGIYKLFDSLGVLIQERESDTAGKRIRTLLWLPEEQRFLIDSAKSSKKHWSNGNYMIHQPLNGKHTLYNKYRQITKDGIFQDNQFMDGKVYIYDDKQILSRIAIYNDGKYVSDAPIE